MLYGLQLISRNFCLVKYQNSPQIQVVPSHIDYFDKDLAYRYENWESFLVIDSYVSPADPLIVLLCQYDTLT